MKEFHFVALLYYQQLLKRLGFFLLLEDTVTAQMGYFKEPNNPHPSPSSPTKVALLIAQTVEQLLLGGAG